ncbi:MAG: hypothetical protein MZW92_77220 [Comamonadaceae bacterium]|nr:hypothetical protein [Comamonadaceae bacterium]
MADLDYGTLRVYPGNYDDYMTAVDAGARAPARRQRQGEGADRRAAGVRAPLLAPTSLQGAAGHQPRASRSRRSRSRTSSRPAAAVPVHPLRARREGQAAPAARWRSRTSASATIAARRCSRSLGFTDRGRRARRRSSAPNGVGKTTLLRCLVGELTPTARHASSWAEKAQPATSRRTTRPTSPSTGASPTGSTGCAVDAARRRRRRLMRGTLGRLLFSGDEVKKSVKVHLRRRAGPHAVRQADAAAAQRAGDGRADQPPGHGIHRVAQHRAGEVSRAR